MKLEAFVVGCGGRISILILIYGRTQETDMMSEMLLVLGHGGGYTYIYIYIYEVSFGSPHNRKMMKLA